MLASPLRAQIRGAVQDQSGQRVPDVVLEFWRGGGRVGVALSNAEGVFIAPDSIRPPITIVARRVGYLPTRHDALGMTADIVLRSRAPLVAGIEVAVDQIRCVGRESHDGRAVWLVARSRYAPVPVYTDQVGRRSRALWGDARVSSRTVPPESLGILDTASLSRGIIMTGGALDGPVPRPSTSQDFYAPVSVGMSGGRHDRYRYPYLDSFESWHFADSLFGAYNFFGEPIASDDSILIDFCSRRGRNQRFITGTLRLAADTSLHSARWSFVTGDERAGGEVVFAPRSSTPAPLLAAIGLAWRRRLRTVHQEWYVYSQWSTCLADCRPANRRPMD